MLAYGFQGFGISGFCCCGVGSPSLDFRLLNFWSASRGFTVGHVDFLCLDSWMHGRDDSGFLGTKRGGLGFFFLPLRFTFICDWGKQVI